MGLHDRLKSTNGASATMDLLGASSETSHEPAPVDPYAELKTRIHHACIATLGAELFKSQGTEDLSERVTRAVTEQLIRDAGYEPVYGGPLANAAAQEQFLKIMGGINNDIGPFFYRFWSPA